MSLEPWDEVRTALHVARNGTVSAAANALGVHHATVIRHIDALEDRISVKLFQRHARGYTPTEAGRALFDVAQDTEQRFDQLEAQLKAMQEGISGPLIITTIPEISDVLLPWVASLTENHPALEPCLRTEERVLRLEYAEAHVAIRAGAQPQEPDNVVQSLGTLPVALFSSAAYLDRHGQPLDDDALRTHAFVAADGSASRAPYEQWLKSQGHRIAFRSNDHATRMAAIRAGLGLGFAPRADCMAEMVEVMPPRSDWQSALWLVTHVDLHRSPKVQAATRSVRAFFQDMLSG